MCPAVPVPEARVLGRAGAAGGEGTRRTRLAGTCLLATWGSIGTGTVARSTREPRRQSQTVDGRSLVDWDENSKRARDAQAPRRTCVACAQGAAAGCGVVMVVVVVGMERSHIDFSVRESST